MSDRLTVLDTISEGEPITEQQSAALDFLQRFVPPSESGERLTVQSVKAAVARARQAATPSGYMMVSIGGAVYRVPMFDGNDEDPVWTDV